MTENERLQHLVGLEKAERLRDLAKLSEAEQEEFPGHWRLWARKDQLPPAGDWRIWLVMAGRGFGKTRAGAEWVREIAEANPDAHIALVAASLGEARAVMVEGESGVLGITGLGYRPRFEPSLRRLVWPNGAQATLYSAGEPESLRGPQHSHACAGQAQKEFFVNEAHALTDALLHCDIEGTASDPPASPVEGQNWLVGASATGDWVGQEGLIACRQAGNWLYVVPRDGMRIFDRSTGRIILYNGVWNAPAAPASPSGGTTVDAEARTAIGALIAALRLAGVFPAT